MNVTHFETSAVTIQTARPESGETALVRQFGQRIDLVHELAELAAAEEVTHDGGERLRIDELGGSHGVHVHVEQGHALFHQTLGAGQAHAALVGEQFTHGTHTAAAEMVNIIQNALTFTQVEEVAQCRNDVLSGEDAHFGVDLQRELLIDLVAAHAGEVITLRIKEQAFHERACIRRGGRIARTQTAVDFLESFIFILRGVFAQGGDEQVVRGGGDDFDGFVAQLDELTDNAGGQRLIGTCHDEFAVEDVLEEDLGGDFLFGNAVLELQVLDLVEELEDVLIAREADHAQERGGKELTAAAAAVEIDVEQVVRVELHFQPGTTVRDDAEAVQPAAIEMLGGFKADTRGTVKLGDDHTLSTVDDERAAHGHEGDFTHVNALLLGTLLVFELIGDV